MNMTHLTLYCSLLLGSQDETGKLGNTLYGEDNIGAYVDAQYQGLTLKTLVVIQYG